MIEHLRNDDDLQVVRSLSLDLAQTALGAIQGALERDGKRAVAAVSDGYGELLALIRFDGAPAPSVLVATNKVWTAARMGMTTGALGQRAREEKWDFAYFGDSRYLGWGGGVPVSVAGQVVGAVAVSGLSQVEDEWYADVGVRAIEEVLTKRPTATT